MYGRYDDPEEELDSSPEWRTNTRAFQLLISSLSTFSTLKVLSLGSEARARISDEALSMLISTLSEKHQLESFRLRFNGIGYIGCKALARWLSSPNCTLTKFYFNWNFHGSGDMLPALLFEGLEDNTSLKDLDLADNFFASTNHCLVKNGSMIELDLSP